MMRINISQQVDGVNYHAEAEGVEAAKEFLDFLESRTKEAFSRSLHVRPQYAVSLEAVTQGAIPIELPLAAQAYSAPMTVAGNITAPAKEEAPKWTREALQPIVVNLAKQREKFMGILEQFGAARFRDVPDDKLNDFGIACAAAQPTAVAA